MPIGYDRNDDSIDGSSSVVRATATTTWTAYPTVAPSNIYEFTITLDPDAASSRRLWVAYSSGSSNYVVLGPGDSWTWKPRQVTQLWVRTASSTADFQLSYSYEF